MDAFLSKKGLHPKYYIPFKVQLDHQKNWEFIKKRIFTWMV